MHPKKLRFIELLNDMLTVLEALNPEQLNLRRWVNREDTPACGTIACIIGHCALNPEFSVKYGITLEEKPYSAHPVVMEADGSKLEDWPAVHKVLGIKRPTSVGTQITIGLDDYLFVAQSYANRKPPPGTHRVRHLKMLVESGAEFTEESLDDGNLEGVDMIWEQVLSDLNEVTGHEN